ncbi:hypothetical protein NC652_035204 [Populus alba x Populus x berolinensis]|nr:hypothetical protein NC652_035204 [Populus alba x Populus x berolinensis]
MVSTLQQRMLQQIKKALPQSPDPERLAKDEVFADDGGPELSIYLLRV